MHKSDIDLISVIIPSYNRYSMLLKAIDSVLNQTYDNYEIIIVLDSYTDSVKEDLQRKFFGIKNITILEGEKLGGAQARNIGMDIASGDYIAFLDDDDTWISTKLEEQLKCFKKNPNAALVFCNINLKYTDRLIPIKKKKHVYIKDLFLNNYVGSFSFVMIKNTKHRISPNMKSLQDWYLWIKILESNVAKYCVNTDTILVNYTMHNEGKISKLFSNLVEGHSLFLKSFEYLFTPYIKKFHRLRILKKKNNNKLYFNLFSKSLLFIMSNFLNFKGNLLLLKILISKEKR